MTSCRPIQSVVILVIKKSDSRFAVIHFVNRLFDYRPNGTPLVPSTIIIYLFSGKTSLNGPGSLVHLGSLKCIHPQGGGYNVAEGTKLLIHCGCSESRQDKICLSLPILLRFRAVSPSIPMKLVNKKRKSWAFGLLIFLTAMALVETRGLLLTHYENARLH